MKVVQKLTVLCLPIYGKRDNYTNRQRPQSRATHSSSLYKRLDENKRQMAFDRATRQHHLFKLNRKQLSNNEWRNKSMDVRREQLLSYHVVR